MKDILIVINLCLFIFCLGLIIHLYSINNTTHNLHYFEKKIYDLETHLFKIEKLLIDQTEMFIPTIEPLNNKDTLNFGISSSFGMRRHPILFDFILHTGIDYMTNTGTMVISTANGVVKKISDNKYGYGKHIIIDHGYNITTLYGHLSEINVKQGDIVHKGQFIGRSGMSGLVSGPHLHYEIRMNNKPINPKNFIKDVKNK